MAKPSEASTSDWWRVRGPGKDAAGVPVHPLTGPMIASMTEVNVSQTLQSVLLLNADQIARIIQVHALLSHTPFTHPIRTPHPHHAHHATGARGGARALAAHTAPRPRRRANPVRRRGVSSLSTSCCTRCVTWALASSTRR